MPRENDVAAGMQAAIRRHLAAPGGADKSSSANDLVASRCWRPMRPKQISLTRSPSSDEAAGNLSIRTDERRAVNRTHVRGQKANPPRVEENYPLERVPRTPSTRFAKHGVRCSARPVLGPETIWNFNFKRGCQKRRPPIRLDALGNESQAQENTMASSEKPTFDRRKLKRLKVAKATSASRRRS